MNSENNFSKSLLSNQTLVAILVSHQLCSTAIKSVFSPESDQGQLKNGSMFYKYQTQMVSVKRQCPYHSFGTLAFEICLSFGSQLPRENHVPKKGNDKQ